MPMNKSKVVNEFTFHLLRFKREVNINYREEFANDVYLIIFNHIIDLYPDPKWFAIKDEFFIHLPYQDIELSIIYTILAYKLGPSFLNTFDDFIKDLIDALIMFKVSPHQLKNYAQIFLNDANFTKISEGYFNHHIKPRHIFKLILDSYTPEDILQKEEEIKRKIAKYVDEHKLLIFNGNYNFFNVYRSLKGLLTFNEIAEPTTEIELIPLFYTIPDSKIKKQITEDFAHIETCDKPLMEKIADCLTIARHYGYYLPLAENKEPKL